MGIAVGSPIFGFQFGKFFCQLLGLGRIGAEALRPESEDLVARRSDLLAHGCFRRLG